MPSLPDFSRPFDLDDVEGWLAAFSLPQSSAWWYAEAMEPFRREAATALYIIATNALDGIPRAAVLPLPPPGRASAWSGYGSIRFGPEVSEAPPGASARALQRIDHNGTYYLVWRYVDPAGAVHWVALLTFGVIPADAPGRAVYLARPGGLPPDEKMQGLPADASAAS